MYWKGILLSIPESTSTVIEQIKIKPQETLEFILGKPMETFSFQDAEYMMEKTS